VTDDADAFNAFEAAGWEQQVAGYEQFFVPITGRLAGPLLDAARVAAGTRVLDVATGPGHIAGEAAGRGASVIGVDVAHGMLALARRTYPQVEFVHGDAEALPFEDGAFDAVVAGFLLLHLGRPERVVAEFARVLRPGGRVALSTWDFPDRSRFQGVLLEAIAEAGAQPPADLPPGPPMFRFADEDELARLLAAFEDVEIETVAFPLRFGARDVLWDGLLGGTVRASVLVQRQPPAVRERIRAAFDRIVGGAEELPVSVKLATGVAPASAAT
jgi:SAM-dependent methyltransferase